ncbi:MAG: ribosome biogenesis GTP-binding protein YihA/YsxC, partial [Bacteroidota bacterium]
MQIKHSEFLGSSVRYQDCPSPVLPEYALIGRSNVGKSSLLNRLTNRKDLAKVSQKPGKTQTINHFKINHNWYLVDLPGYGWARVSKESRYQWSRMLEEYFLNRENLLCVFALIDSRLEPQEIDLDFLRFLGESEIPFTMVFTKIDKLKKGGLAKNIAHYEAVMLEEWEEMPHYFLTSAQTG